MFHAEATSRGMAPVLLLCVARFWCSMAARTKITNSGCPRRGFDVN